MKLIIQPDDGIEPILSAIRKAKTSLDVGIFRLDRRDIAELLAVAAGRGVAVRTLIAHTNRGGEKKLRRLEQALLKTGAGVRRTDTDLVRYHSKVMVVDRKSVYILAFNYTALDLKSRSFAVVSKKRELVAEALKLFEADSLRQDYAAGSKSFLVSPVNSRERLAEYLKGARKELLIYHVPKLTDTRMIRIIKERIAAGVSVRILGKAGGGLTALKIPGVRLHLRAVIRDGKQAFMGSQGLRKLELDHRREVGVIVKDRKVVAKMAAIFEEDWAAALGAMHGVAVAGKKGKPRRKVKAKPASGK